VEVFRRTIEHYGHADIFVELLNFLGDMPPGVFHHQIEMRLLVHIIKKGKRDAEDSQAQAGHQAEQQNYGPAVLLQEGFKLRGVVFRLPFSVFGMDGQDQWVGRVLSAKKARIISTARGRPKFSSSQAPAWEPEWMKILMLYQQIRRIVEGEAGASPANGVPNLELGNQMNGKRPFATPPILIL
jgi:hypothetical protein